MSLMSLFIMHGNFETEHPENFIQLPLEFSVHQSKEESEERKEVRQLRLGEQQIGILIA